MNPVAFDWFDRIPKAELHVHMEGAIPVGTLRELIVKYEGKSEAPSLEELQQKFTYRDFPHFIEIWIWKNNYLREYEDFSFIAKDTIAQSATLNIESIPTQARCHQCGEVFLLEEVKWTCPDCANKNLEIVAGNELFVDSIEVE